MKTLCNNFNNKLKNKLKKKIKFQKYISNLSKFDISMLNINKSPKSIRKPIKVAIANVFFLSYK